MNVNADKLKEALDELLISLPAGREETGFAAFLGQIGQVINEARCLTPQDLSQVVTDWESKQKSPLFNELGQLLRRFHDDLSHLPDELPEGLKTLDPSEVGTMTGKLRHVLELTGNAANRTLDLSEEAIEALSEEKQRLHTLREEVVGLGDEKCLTQKASKRVNKILAGLDGALNANEAHQRRINDILMTQDYQDLSGQLIHKILGLLGGLEHDLSHLLERFGNTTEQNKAHEPLKGPLTQDHQDRHDQTDVDGLLDQFGF